MAPSQLRKRLTRKLMVSWREQPTRYDIEALQANIRRVGLVVRMRWMVLALLVVYSAVAGLFYAGQIGIKPLADLMVVPALTLGFVVFYNTYYSLNYRRLGSIAVWNNLQLALDALVVTVLVYFSGGVNSWFWSMYALFILEAAFILPRSGDAWLHAALSIGLLGAVEFLELPGWLPHNEIPFATGDSYRSLVFVTVRYFWQLAVLLGMAWVSTLLVGEFRREIESRRAHSLIDDATGLYSRGYFERACVTELLRAQRDNRPLHVLLLDVDHFGEFNRRFGFDAGDRFILELSRTLSDVVGRVGDGQATTNLVARLGGEEFAVLFAEDSRLTSAPGCDDAEVMAQSVREAIEAIRVGGAGVTVSVGVASMPDDGFTYAEVLDAADIALAAAIEAGGHRVVAASECAVRAEDAAVEHEA